MLTPAETEQPTLRDVLAYRRGHSRSMPLVVSVTPDDSIADAVELLRRYGISQTPVIYDGRMVDVAPTSEKLRRRAARVVAELTGAGDLEVQRVLSESGGSAKVAVLMLKTGLAARAARARLTAVGGDLGLALDEL